MPGAESAELGPTVSWLSNPDYLHKATLVSGTLAAAFDHLNAVFDLLGTHVEHVTTVNRFWAPGAGGP